MFLSPKQQAQRSNEEARKKKEKEMEEEKSMLALTAGIHAVNLLNLSAQSVMNSVLERRARKPLKKNAAQLFDEMVAAGEVEVPTISVNRLKDFRNRSATQTARKMKR